MVLIVVVVAIGLAFDFTNGFHDTANYVATWVGTRALSPRPAVLVSAVANLAGAFVTTAVAKTVAKGIIDTNLATEQTMLAALFGAIVWNLLTWRLGLPSSSTHALIGGLVGAALVQSGTSGVEWSGPLAQGHRPGRRLAGDRLRRSVPPPSRHLLALPPAHARRREPGLPARASSSPAPGSPSPTARTTRRRRWA